MVEAQRRATEIRTRVMAAAPLSSSRWSPASPRGPAPRAWTWSSPRSARRRARSAARVRRAGAGRPTGQLESGEGGKRQIREAVQAAQPSIEACVGEHDGAAQLARAEGDAEAHHLAAGQGREGRHRRRRPRRRGRRRVPLGRVRRLDVPRPPTPSTSSTFPSPSSAEGPRDEDACPPRWPRSPSPLLARARPATRLRVARARRRCSTTRRHVDGAAAARPSRGST